MSAEPQCRHKRWCIIASEATIASSAGGDCSGYLVHWCPDCGAIRPATAERRGPWLVPGSKRVQDMLEKLRERRLALGRQGVIDA